MKKKALLIIDHGSKRKEANDMLEDVVKMLRKMKPHLIIEGAHMELAEPGIAEGIENCVKSGATDIMVQPMMFSPGRHATKDIPNLVNEASKKYPTLTIQVGSHLGVHPKLGELLLSKAGFCIHEEDHHERVSK